MSSLLSIVTVAVYLAAAALLLRRFRTEPATDDTAVSIRGGILALSAGAAVLHAALLYPGLRVDGGLNLALTNALSLMACAIVALFVLIALFRRIENLGILILPVAAASVLIAWLWPGHQVVLPRMSPLMLAHLVIAFLAYSLLTVAVVQALLLWWQERRLHQPHSGRLLRSMPPLQSMEGVLFGLISVGFVLLTLTLVSGTLFSEEIFEKPLVINHHIVLSLIGWFIFGILLFGHWRFGWRGRHAVRWTLGGFALLLLGYFGSKFVLEVLLGR